MNRHLSEAEIVDVLDGVLPPARAAHLDHCAPCRERAESLRAIASRVQQTGGNSVPEPSPLFWEHFSSRVSEAVSEIDAPSQTAGWHRAPFAAWLAAAATLVLAVAVFWSYNRLTPDVSGPATPPLQEPAVATADDGHLDLEDDADWALVRVVADELLWDDAPDAGITAHPGSADRAALELSAVERQELARILAVELKL
jgi:hypothetical protein